MGDPFDKDALLKEARAASTQKEAAPSPLQKDALLREARAAAQPAPDAQPQPAPGQFRKDLLLAEARSAAGKALTASKKAANVVSEKAVTVSKKAAVTVSEKAKDGAKAIQKHKSALQAQRQNEAQARQDVLARYAVRYRGGLPQYPKEQGGEIGLCVLRDGFLLRSTSGSRRWFADFMIPYDRVHGFEIIPRQAGALDLVHVVLPFMEVGTGETEVCNVIAITYDDPDGTEVYLRLEMQTGVYIIGQAKKCQELLDVLRQNRILGRLNVKQEAPILGTADELMKYKALLDDGVLTQEEFDAKKRQLLNL